jgi:hypothetical protein
MISAGLAAHQRRVHLQACLRYSVVTLCFSAVDPLKNGLCTIPGIQAPRCLIAIFAGISLEVCAAFPAITAVGKGFDAYAAVDASGTFSETKRQVGLLRMLQAAKRSFAS